MRPPLHLLAALRALTGALLAAAAMAASPQPAPSAHVSLEGDRIVFRGRIDQDSAARFSRLLQQSPEVSRVVISSAGGLVSPALDMAQAIHARRLDVEVRQACLSSCANYIFPAARRKFLSHAGAVGWHGNMTHVLYLAQTGQGHWSEPLLQEARELARREAAFFESIGVDGFVCWFGKLAPYGVQDFYTLEPHDMAVFGIADVTLTGTSGPQDAGSRTLAVDWRGLDALRPTIGARD